MTIAGMSVGSWILILVIIVWAAISIKSYFFGGFKRKKKKGLSVGNCCDTGDDEPGGCAACSARGDAETAASANAVLPIVKDIK